MKAPNADWVVQLAHADVARGDMKRAKDRLRAVLRSQPYHVPALELMGSIYYSHADYRNAVMYWARADHWDELMIYACERVFRSTGRALAREKPRAVRYQLYAFAGSTPPPNIAQKLSACQSAYFRLGDKRARHTSLACAPVAGGFILAVLGLVSGLLGGGWSSFLWGGGVALASTIIVIAINTWSYYRSAKLFHESIQPLVHPRTD